MDTESITVDPRMHDEAQEILSTYTRLTVSVRRTWFGFGRSVFMIQGPAEAISAAKREIAHAESKAWIEDQW